MHASGADLLRLGDRLSETPQARVLDIGCGAGHASFVAAQYVKEVVAYDLSERMPVTAGETADAHGYHHLTTQQGYAKNLPFSDAEFDMVISRYSAHRWHDVTGALREVRRETLCQISGCKRWRHCGTLQLYRITARVNG